MQELPCGCHRNGTSFVCPAAERLWADVNAYYRVASVHPYNTIEAAETWIAYLEKHLEYDRHIHNTEAIERLSGELQKAQERLTCYKKR